jgi:hypothetical protein
MIALLLCSACSTSRSLVASDERQHATPSVESPPRETAPETEPPASSSDGPFYEPDPKGGTTPMLRLDAPNVQYASMDRESCLAELRRRSIAFEHAPRTRGVVTPVWLRGRLHGVWIHSPLPPKNRKYSSAEIFDCRLVLAIDDFASLVAEHGVVEIVHLSAFRPRSAKGCTPKYDGKQHCAALALDVGSFRKKDGTVLDVERDFHGKIGLGTCAGEAGPKPATRAAEELWGWVCESARRGTFHVILTPNYNRAHRNHFHLEITPDADWMLIQ